MNGAAARGQPGVIHANHAGTSWPKAPGVAVAVAAALGADPREHGAQFAAAHARIAAFFDLPAPERLLLAPSCTAATALLLASLPWTPGDVVLTSSLEHHALAGPLQQLVWHRGVEHVAAPYRPGAPLDLDVVAATLRAGRVRLVAITGASNVTGERLPVAELTALAHAHGALVLLDTAQLAGAVPLSIAALGVDAIVFAGHKALLGPQGIGGLWAAPHVAFACPAATCAIGERAAGAPPAAALRAPFPGFCDVGSVNLAGAVGLATAMDWLAAQPPAELARPLAMRARLRAALAGRSRVRALGGDGPHTATLSLVGDALPLATAEAHFAAHGLLVRAGRHCAPMALAALGEPDGCVRISFGPHNRDADVDVVLAAIAAAGG